MSPEPSLLHGVAVGDAALRDPWTFQRSVWLLPAAFAPHIAEEYLGGFPLWVTDVLGGKFNNVAFALNNAVFMVTMIALTLWVRRTNSRVSTFILVAWGSGNIFWDALFHIGATALMNRYSPGLVTSSLFYMPLSVTMGARLLREKVLPTWQVAASLLCGLGLLAFVMWSGLFHFAH